MPKAKVKFKSYRTYNFIDKDPMIDKLRTAVQDVGLIKKLGIVSKLSNVSYGAIDGWFNGDTKMPRHAGFAAVAAAIGYEIQLLKERKLDIEKELVEAREWLKKQETYQKRRETRAAKRRKKKANGK